MAFVCTAAANNSVITEVDGNILLPVGHDDDAGRTFFTFNGFAPVVGGGAMEYLFCLVEFDPLEGAEHRYWNGADVARFIGKNDREKILDVFIYGARVLLEHDPPSRVFMCTSDTNLPEPAMRKYLLMADVFKEAGYDVAEALPELGVRSWWIELPDRTEG